MAGANNFIAEWSPMLPPATRDYYRALGIALRYFRMQDYEACYKEIPTDLSEHQDKLRGRLLEIIALYEMGKSINYMEYRCTAFEKYIRNNRFIHQSTKEGVLLSIKILRMLLKPVPDKAKIRAKIESGQNFHYRSWFKLKLEEL